MNHPSICIIIINWNGWKDTAECLDSLLRISYANYHVIVVDNDSQGQDVEILKERFGEQIHIIENQRNSGFAEGNNIGIRYALGAYSPDYVLLLNNDTTVSPGFLTEMVTVSEDNPKLGILGPRVFYYDLDGKKDAVWFTGGGIRWWHPSYWKLLDLSGDQFVASGVPVVVDWVSGAAMLIRREVIESISLLDARYFFGHEDIDYCSRARKNDYRVAYVPRSFIWHKVGRSRTKYDPGFGNIFLEYQLIRRTASTPVYLYHLMLIPLVLTRWAAVFLTKYRDRRTLKRILATFRPFSRPNRPPVC
jgi:GT2 family glycosyltransferase